MKSIKITGISQDQVKYGMKTTIEAGKEKYSFFDKKKDGNLTKAMEQFKKYKFAVGDQVNVEVKEEEKSFTGKEGNTVKYTQRTILYFEEIENTPTHTSSPAPKDPPKSELGEIKRLVMGAIEDVFDKMSLEGDKEMPTEKVEETSEDLPW